MTTSRARSLTVGLLLTIGLLLTVAAVVPVGAADAGGQAQPVALQVKLHRVFNGWVNGHCGPAAASSQAFALFSFSPSPTQTCASGFLVFDDRTGKRSVINTSTCRHGTFPVELVTFGAPWALFSCGNGQELYNLTTHRWGRLDCPAACSAPPGGDVVREAIGARWLEIDVQMPGPCGDGIHNDCGPVQRRFVNLVTRRVRHTARTNATTILDLNSTTLVRHLCRPLRVPAGGSLTMEGTFAVVNAVGGSYVQRCGSTQRTPLLPGAPSVAGGGIQANLHVVLWEIHDLDGVWHGNVAGVLLPTLRRFTAAIEPSVSRYGALMLGTARLYLAGDSGGLWAARFPG